MTIADLWCKITPQYKNPISQEDRGDTSPRRESAVGFLFWGTRCNECVGWSVDARIDTNRCIEYFGVCFVCVQWIAAMLFLSWSMAAASVLSAMIRAS